MPPHKKSELAAFIDSCEFAVVSTLGPDGTPQSAVVGIAVTPQLEIVFDTVASSRKYRNLKANPACSITMWKDEATVQLEGVAEESGEEREVYFRKHGRDRMVWDGITYFVVRPRWVRISDFSTEMIEEFSM